MNATLTWASFGRIEGERGPHLTATLQALKQVLPPREFLVVALRFGLEGHAPHTIKQIADILGVSNERVRQLEYKAVRSLRG